MHSTYKKWIEEKCPKVFCQCGCNQEIIIQKHHKQYGIPKYIRGHSNKGENPPSGFRKGHQFGFKKGEHASPSTEFKKGIHPSTEFKKGEHISLSTEFKKGEHISPSTEFKKGHIPYMIGKHHSNDAIEKMQHTFFKKGDLPSPKCSRGKGCYYDSCLQGRIYLRSSYELAYAKYLDEHKILWMYEIETFDLDNTTYTPDFFLPQFEKFVEIKGYMRKEAQDKINKFLEQYPWDLEVLFREDLVKLGIELENKI